MTSSTTDPRKTKLLKKYHTLLCRQGVNNEAKMAMLAGYGVESSKELTLAQLVDIIVKLEGGCPEQEKQKSPLEMWRDRAIAAVSDYLRVMGVGFFQKEYEKCTYEEKLKRKAYAIGTIEKAANGKVFGKISQKQLASLYNGFIRTKKDMLAVQRSAMEILSTN